MEAAIQATAEQNMKRERLQAILRSFGSVCIGYSGGVDSVFLATIAVETLGPSNVLAVTGRSASYPAVQRDIAIDCSRDFGIPHLEIETDELSDPNYAANPTNRCYFCKSELWTQLRRVADERGLRVVLDGSNADDAHDYRPGMQAAKEREVRSPLLEAGLTKDDIRALSHDIGLPTWDQPSSPCLSSRLPYGMAVTPQRLREVEAAEVGMRALGFRDFRVRHHGDAARIELPQSELQAAAQRAAEIDGVVRDAGFDRVLLDVDGYRRGALNEGLVQLHAVRDAHIGDAHLSDAHVGAGAAPRTGITAAGHQNEIAVLPPDTDFDKLAQRARHARQSGYRYAAVDLSLFS